MEDKIELNDMRICSQKEINFIVSFYEELYNDKLTTKQIQIWVKNYKKKKKRKICLIKYETEPVGFFSLFYDYINKKLFLESLFIKKEYRRKKIATFILNKLKETNSYFDILSLGTTSEKTEAISFYLANGFKFVKDQHHVRMEYFLNN